MTDVSRKNATEGERSECSDNQNFCCNGRYTKRKWRTRRNSKLCDSIIKHNFEDFCDKTSLHAVQYVGDSGRTVVERLCWLLSIMTSLCISFYLISVQWRKWEDTPIIVSLSDAPTPIWEIPFPAVTICPENKIKHQPGFNFTILFEKDNRTEEEEEILDQLTLLCNSKIFMYKNVIRAEEFKSEINFSTNYIEMFAPKIEDIMIHCEYKDYGVGCDSIFTPIMTEEGICYTFNSFNAKDMLRYSTKFGERFMTGPSRYKWTIEDGFSKDIEDEFKYDDTSYNEQKMEYPRRTNKPGDRGGLVIYLKADERDFDYACRWPVAGFKVLLHNPAEFPRLLTHFFRVPLRRDVIATIDASIMTSSSEIARYPYKRRGCIFQEETYMGYFRNYTMSNCEIECLVNITMDECNCTLFYFPGMENSTLCKTHDACLLRMSDILMRGNILLDICECLPGCEEVSYKARVSQSQLVFPQVLRHVSEVKRNFSESFARLSIYFQDIQYVTSRRSELFGYTDFLANCGGLLGLCCGFSILSAAEIIYSICLCLCGKRRGVP